MNFHHNFRIFDMILMVVVFILEQVMSLTSATSDSLFAITSYGWNGNILGPKSYLLAPIAYLLAVQ